MENSVQPIHVKTKSHQILFKGLTIGSLILLMLIPIAFVSNLVYERQARQQEVVKEVSSKWASPQTLSAPFLVVPYFETSLDDKGKPVLVKSKVMLFANELNVKGDIFPEKRKRSIYTVLLYKTKVNFSGNFKPVIPAGINIANLNFQEAILCFAFSDFKGIEEEVVIDFNAQKYEMNPGLPVNQFGNIGLSVPLKLNGDDLTKGIPFSMDLNLKGSSQLNFLPLAGNSKFQIHSSWPDPSFDGNILPEQRDVNKEGFTAKWNFNRANLPFNLVTKESDVDSENIQFGVSLLQPADQYAKTMRSTKYAILFIGLTFSFFFIIELLQKKYFHPVQYVLVGLALVIFYSLLLSFSEYILFVYAYLIAALATILLITIYVKNHFKSWKTGGIFFGLLTCLYSFIYVLIMLEDTALLVGSIGLFVILALAMYVSRRINWYGDKQLVPAL